MNHMGHHRAFKKLFIFLVIFGIFLDCMMGYFCLCGQGCLNGFQLSTKIAANPLFHVRCQDNQCKSCKLEKGKNDIAVSRANHMQNIKTDKATSLSCLVGFLISNFLHKDINYFHTNIAASSLQIYLQKQTLLC